MSRKLPTIHFTEPVVAFNDVDLEISRISGIAATPLDISLYGGIDSSPASGTRRTSRSSLWGRIVSSFTKLIIHRRSARRPALPAPSALPADGTTMPPQSQEPGDEDVLFLLWRLDGHYLRAVLRLVDHILTVRAMGKAEFVRAQVLYLLAHSRGAVVPLSQLRQRLHDATPGAVNAALLRLEAQGLVALMPASGKSGLDERLAGIAHPTRGLLDRCALWDRRAAGAGDTTAA